MKIDWKNAKQDDLQKLEVIKSLLGKHTHLLDFLFHPEVPQLAGPLKIIKSDMMCFEEEEQVLILCALNFWGSCGGPPLDDLYKKLSGENFSNCLKALVFLRKRRNHVIGKEELFQA